MLDELIRIKICPVGIGCADRVFKTVSVTSGSVSFERAFTQESTGTLGVGISSSVMFDHYAISQSANLDGTLDISLLNSFEPELDELYVIMNFASRIGTFATVNGQAIGNGKKFDVIYEASSVTLKVVADN